MPTLSFSVIAILAMLISGLLPAAPCMAQEQPLQHELIRVAISRTADTVTLDGDGLLGLSESGTAVVLQTPVVVRSGYGQISAGGVSYHKLRVSAAGPLKLNNKSFRGVLELSAANDGLLVVNELPLEQYLVGVINSEISSTWPMESVKAQAVIARTYAVAKRNERRTAPYHLEATVMDQVYDGSDQEDSRAARGVQETEGQVLTYHGTVIQAFYHATCGGKTEDSAHVWGVSLPYLKGVDCQYCAAGNSNVWEQSLSLSKLEAALKVSGLTDIRPGPRNSRGRLKNVLLTTSRGSLTMPATKFRMTVGSTVIKSTNFMVRVEGGTAFFSGAGYGHGVGLCQWGAKQRALDGFSYSEILSYYYPGTELRNISVAR
ncbi:MAG: SpoIID/LytB domain-containing protein [Trichlorobacter sp.]|jgi:stage II sporulation protein D